MHSAEGHTQKYLLRLHDGERIETVLMQYRDRRTACLSSQAGCALGCVFCATGQMGFRRNLTTGEIVSQALHFLNYNAVIDALEILHDPRGLAIGAKQITLSTVGVNLIPLNPTAGYSGMPSAPEAIVRFRSILRDHGLPSTVRQRRGIDVDAGCGQLAGSALAPLVLCTAKN